MPTHDDDDPLEREDRQSRKERRLESLREERGNFVQIALFGVAMFGVGLMLLWFVLISLQRGFIDLDDGPDLLYVGEDPVDFYVSTGFMAAFSLYFLFTGAQMLLHARRETRRTARHEERLTRVGSPRR